MQNLGPKEGNYCCYDQPCVLMNPDAQGFRALQVLQYLSVSPSLIKCCRALASRLGFDDVPLCS